MECRGLSKVELRCLKMVKRDDHGVKDCKVLGQGCSRRG